MPFGTHTFTRTSPFDVGLGAHVDPDKADFIGKAAREAAKDNLPRPLGLRCPDAEPLLGASASAQGTEIGFISAAAWSPFLECGIGYVRFERAGDWAGRSLLMQTRQGQEVDCEIVALPFYDGEKRIPRGLPAAV